MKRKWNELLERPVTRKQFLRVLGGGALVVLNLEGIARLLQHADGTGHPPVSSGYSSGAYSGFTATKGGGPSRKLGGFD